MKTKIKYYEDAQATGTEQYWLGFLGIKYTDGIKSMMIKLECHWLIDIVASYLPKCREVDNGFMLVTLELNGKGGAVFTARTDTGVKPCVKQVIPFTDIKENVKMYLIDGILILPSEY